MPTNLESVNGFSSVKDSSRIPTTHFWKGPYLVASNNNKVANATFVAPMKGSVRSVFSIFILIAFAATVTCRVLIRRSSGGGGAFGFGFGFRSIEQVQTSVMVKPAEPVFNSTLLNYAAIDISEPQTRKDIEQLLDGNFANLGRYKTFDTFRRFNPHDLRSSSSKGVSMMLESPKFYGYWLEFRRLLNNWSRGLRYQPEVMDSLVEYVKDPIDRAIGVFEGSNKKYGSCAVVGNSGILLQKEYGEMIDGHDVVIRLNNAWIERYEKNVGSKTTISFVNSNILHLCARRPGCFCHPYGPNVPLVMYICQPVHFMDYTICNSSLKAPLIITDPRFDVLCTRIVKYYSLKRFAAETGKSLDEWSSVHDGPMFHYSSGMQAIMLAVGACDRVSVFGFGKSASAKHHYHTNQKAELHLHDYEAEYEFYNDLVNNPNAIPFISDDFKFPPVVIYQ